MTLPPHDPTRPLIRLVTRHWTYLVNGEVVCEGDLAPTTDPDSLSASALGSLLVACVRRKLEGYDGRRLSAEGLPVMWWWELAAKAEWVYWPN